MCNSGTGICLPLVLHISHLVDQTELAAATVTISSATARASPPRGIVHQVKAFTPEAFLFALHHSSNFQLLTFDILHPTHFDLAISSELFCQDSSSTLPMVGEDPGHAVGLIQTEEMPALPSNDIPPVDFQRFPDLPAELRLKIWKAACFPYAPNQRGLHYIDLETVEKGLINGALMGSMEMNALHPDFPTSHNGQLAVGRANKSAYMWDAGLWKACRESREVVSAHFQLKLWRNSDFDPIELDECLSKACQPYLSKRYLEESSSEDDEGLYEKRPGDKDSVHEREPFLPTCLLSHNQEHTERFMVMPTRDLFCIKNPYSRLLPLSLEAPRLHTPCPNGKEIVLRNSFNLVLEFDTSWLDHFPGSWHELIKEKSPRGVVARWAQTCGWSKGNAPQIYLLSKAARWGPGWWVNKDTVFHDCDDAYVEVRNHYMDFHPAEPAEASAMLRYLWLVWKLWTVAFCEECTHDETCVMCNNDMIFDLTDYVKVLVRH
ncbi:hypothetical protein FPANT_10697 [Fusarium pseudoanthophilum]|uniref:2EXR domain-containing protein n=1 Tax=Fusarium pseudoanthophilum TaxID=48495 RepID=A0A8H5KR01_9HYPO|nr:hypothetical protein FPANT_10697 [Fusarium pseudoanthophilum]